MWIYNLMINNAMQANVLKEWNINCIRQIFIPLSWISYQASTIHSSKFNTTKLAIKLYQTTRVGVTPTFYACKKEYNKHYIVIYYKKVTKTLEILSRLGSRNFKATKKEIKQKITQMCQTLKSIENKTVSNLK